MTLHDELSRLADASPRPSIDHTLWDRGRGLRRRDRLVASALVLAMVVILGGVAALVLSPQRAVDPADGPVPNGAIPSRIYQLPADVANGPLEKDLAIGRASVAFTSFNVPIVIGATDGKYHLLDLPREEDASISTRPLALSPDGTRLAWVTGRTRFAVADLESGRPTHFSAPGVEVINALDWDADSTTLRWRGPSDDSAAPGGIDVTSRQWVPSRSQPFDGVWSPDGNLFVVSSDSRPHPINKSVRFDRRDDQALHRTLPRDLYPKGASVTPLAWASDSLVVAVVEDAETRSAGRHLVLFTSPDQPKSQWTYRILVRNVEPVPISVATDLIPDLDGTSSQQLTHDFGEPEWAAGRDISWIIGLGVAGAVAVLMGLRWLWRRRTHLS